MRSALATVLGWVLVALVAFWAFGIVVGTLAWMLRSVAWIVLIVVVGAAWLTLKSPPDS